MLGMAMRGSPLFLNCMLGQARAPELDSLFVYDVKDVVVKSWSGNAFGKLKLVERKQEPGQSHEAKPT